MNQSLNNTAVSDFGLFARLSLPNLQQIQIPSCHVELLQFIRPNCMFSHGTLDFRIKCSLFVLLCFVCFPCPENLIGFVSSDKSERKQGRNCDRRIASSALQITFWQSELVLNNWLPVDDMPSFWDIYLSKKNVVLPLNTKSMFMILRCERKHCSDCHVIQQLCGVSTKQRPKTVFVL